MQSVMMFINILYYTTSILRIYR